jgi:hypothetical protein
MNDGRNNNNKDESADIMANLFKKLSLFHVIQQETNINKSFLCSTT